MSLLGVFTEEIPGDQTPERVDKLVARRMPDVTRAEIQRWIADGRVTLDGRICKPKDKVRPGNLLVVRPDQPQPSGALPDPSVVIDVLFEDEHLLVVNKPAGLVVHPGRGHRTGTLVNGLLARPGFERAPMDPRDPEGYLRPGIVHRIDKETSGILMVAKDALTREGLKDQLSKHTVTRVYQALTIGCPKAQRIKTLHGRDPHSRLKFSSKVRTGKTAITTVSVRSALAGSRAAHVECRLETGRTHQIRVHLSLECGTPILADALYGGTRGDPEIVQIGKALGRHALHAGVLGFVHPQTKQYLEFSSPLPSDMQVALAALGAHLGGG